MEVEKNVYNIYRLLWIVLFLGRRNRGQKLVTIYLSRQYVETLSFHWRDSTRLCVSMYYSFPLSHAYR